MKSKESFVDLLKEIGMLTLALGTFVWPVVVMLCFLLLEYLYSIFTTLDKEYGKLTTGLVGAAVALLAGVGIYFLRQKRLGTYALLEFTAAVVTAWLTVGQVREQGDFTVWLGLIASASLVVSGIENVKKALGMTDRG